ncbi:hypothetical protein ACOXPO_004764, partial [Escherichia coli O4:H45]
NWFFASGETGCVSLWHIDMMGTMPTGMLRYWRVRRGILRYHLPQFFTMQSPASLAFSSDQDDS